MKQHKEVRRTVVFIFSMTKTHFWEGQAGYLCFLISFLVLFVGKLETEFQEKVPNNILKEVTKGNRLTAKATFSTNMSLR